MNYRDFLCHKSKFYILLSLSWLLFSDESAIKPYQNEQKQLVLQKVFDPATVSFANLYATSAASIFRYRHVKVFIS